MQATDDDDHCANGALPWGEDDATRSRAASQLGPASETDGRPAAVLLRDAVNVICQQLQFETEQMRWSIANNIRSQISSDLKLQLRQQQQLRLQQKRTQSLLGDEQTQRDAALGQTAPGAASRQTTDGEQGSGGERGKAKKLGASRKRHR
eukprot:Selendium_serpulae@DN5687_c0_g1_i1.p2